MLGGVTMSYGGDVHNEVPDATSIIVDDDAPSRHRDTELNSRPKKRAAVKPRISSTNSVHELLQCPVCSSLMYPPIFQVFNCFGKYFCLHFEAFMLGTAPVYMAFLRYMGEADEANGFRYSLEVGASERRQVWQGVPRSIRDGHQRVRESMDGLVVPRRLALFFSDSNHRELKLRVMGRIWKEHQVTVAWIAV